MMRFAVAIILAVLGFARPAHAQGHVMPGWIPPYACQPDRGAPPPMPAALTEGSLGVEFRTCRDLQDNAHYFLREPRPNRDGVCRIYEHEIFPGASGDRAFFHTRYDPDMRSFKGWRDVPPPNWKADGYAAAKDEFALVTPGQCPSSFDPRYVSVQHVTDGMLKALDRAWRAAIVSPQAFDKAFASVALRFGASPPLKTKLQGDALAGTVRFADVSCGDDGCVAHTKNVDIGFDIENDRLVFTYLAPVYEI